MLSAKLAFRNMLAHGQRSRTMFVAVGLVSCVVFLLLAFSDGQIANLDAGILSLSDPTADVVVYPKGLRRAYRQHEDWSHLSANTIKKYPALLEELRALPFVRRAVSPTSPLTLDLYAAGQRHEKFFMRGVDPEQPWLIQDRVQMRTGEFFDRSDKPQVILHYKTARTIGVEPGGTVILSGRDLFGQVVVQPAVLKGYFAGEQDVPRLAELAFMNMAAYRLVSGLGPDEAMALFVDLKKGTDRAAALTALERHAGLRKLDLEFWSYDQLPELTAGAEDVRRIYGMIRLIVVAAGIIILLIVTFGIMNVVSVNLYDRRREVGTYYCLGSEKPFLIRLYTVEILLLNMTSAALGVGVGLAIRWAVNAARIRTDESGLQLVFGGSQFSLGMSARTILFIAVAMFAITVLTAVTTLGSRLRVSPVAALREVE